MLTTPYPSHLIDPAEKGYNWILTYAKAAWREYSTVNPKMLYNQRSQYAVIKSYAQGRQSNTKYKPLMGVAEDDDQSALAIDWGIIPIIPKFRRIALQRLGKRKQNIVATPVDPTAIDDKEQHIAGMKAKIGLREQMDKIAPGMADQIPELQMQPNEPSDNEELAITADFTYKHRAALEAEMGINLVFTQNNFEELRRQTRENLIDFGIGGYREYLDNNNSVKIRVIKPENLIISPCRRRDFSDKQHAGEVIELTIAELKQMAGEQITAEQYQKIIEGSAGKWGNSKTIPWGAYDNVINDWKVRVLDLEFFSVNEKVFEKRKTKAGNVVFGKTDYKNKNRQDGYNKEFKRTSFKVVYKTMWVIDTDVMFNYGLATDMKRWKSNYADTDLSFHLFAPDFYDMYAQGLTEQMMSIADNIQVAWYRLQNVINSARPKGIAIEIGALEDIPLGKGGTKMSPLQVLDLYNKQGTLIYRKLDPQGRQVNYKPIEELNNGMGSQAQEYFGIIQQNMQMLRDITGLNELTDGSTPGERTLTTVANAAMEATNNSLGHFVDADRWLTEKLADAVLVRLQSAIKKGPVEGYVKSLGKNTVEFMKVSDDISKYSYAIGLEDVPEDQDKARLIQSMQIAIEQGQITPEDQIAVDQCENLKLANMILAYRIKKRERQKQQDALQMQQANAQTQIQSAQAAEEAKRKTFEMTMQIEMAKEKMRQDAETQRMQMKLEAMIEIEKMKLGVGVVNSAVGAATKIQTSMTPEDKMAMQMPSPTSLQADEDAQEDNGMEDDFENEMNPSQEPPEPNEPGEEPEGEQFA